MLPARGGVGAGISSNRPDLEASGSSIFGHIWLDAFLLKVIRSAPLYRIGLPVGERKGTDLVADNSYWQRRCNTLFASESMTTLRIETSKPEAFSDKAGLPEGVSIKFAPLEDHPFVGEAMIAALVTIPVSIATNLISSWIYDRWKNKIAPEPLKLNNEVVIEVTVERITEIITNDKAR